MVQRPKTPPIQTPNELITIWNPWPPAIRISDKQGIHEEDCKTMVRWIANIGVPPENIYSLYWKPKNKSTVLVEIGETKQFESLLIGSHKWSDAFTKLGEFEVDQESRCFQCSLANYRIAEKLGWKVQPVQEEWFDKFNLKKNTMIKRPYPKPTYCKFPDSVDIKEVCKGIPHYLFPNEKGLKTEPDPVTPANEPKASHASTPGASGWGDAKTSGAPMPRKPKPQVFLEPAQQTKRNFQPIRKQPAAASNKDEIDLQAMRATLEVSKAIGDSMAPEPFDWFQDVEEHSEIGEIEQENKDYVVAPSWDSSSEDEEGYFESATWGLQDLGAALDKAKVTIDPEADVPPPPEPSSSKNSKSTNFRKGSQRAPKPSSRPAQPNAWTNKPKPAALVASAEKEKSKASTGPSPKGEQPWREVGQASKKSTPRGEGKLRSDHTSENGRGGQKSPIDSPPRGRGRGRGGQKSTA